MKNRSTGRNINRTGLITALSGFLILLSSCTGKDDFSTGEDFTEELSKLSIVDTFSVNLSTVLLDSLSTSGTGITIVGQHHDDNFGTVRATGYFRPAFQTFNLDGNYVFDSAVVALVYSGYSYGDTTELMTMNVYQLDEDITVDDDNYIYNHTHFDHSERLLGTRSFYPHPRSPDTLFLPVWGFGQQLFSMFLYQDADVSTSENFLKYVKGFALETTGGSAVIGFKSDAAQTLLKFYYHFKSSETITESSFSLPFGAVTYQFNEISNDFSGTPLEGLRPAGQATPSSETGGMVFMQGLTGLLPKIEFPTLQDITFEERWRILRAELVMTPVVESYSSFGLPEQLCLYKTDGENTFGSILTSDDGSVVYSLLNTDELYNEDTEYTIDITSYLNSELSDGYYDIENGMLAGISTDEMKETLNRLQVECNKPEVKLRLYYLKY